MVAQRFAYLPILFLACSGLEAQRNRIAAPIDSHNLVTLEGHVSPRARRAADQGEVANSFPMRGITLMLKRSPVQQAALQKLLADQSTAGSASYHQWLTPEQYAGQFGASAADIDQIAKWLENQGFTIDQVARSRTFITFSGIAGQVNSALHTRVHRYLQDGETHYANATAPALPAAIADMTSSLMGLHDFRMKPRLRKPLNADLNTGNGAHHIGPDDFATIYNIAPLYAAGIDGTGQKIAVVGQTALNLADINKFRSYFGLSAPNVEPVLVPSSTDPGTNSGDLEEADLDVEWAGAVARNATIVYVYSTDVFTSLKYAIDNNLALVISMSYGGCEPQDLVDLPSYQSLAQQANAQGQTWVTASGDQGAGDCEDQGAAVAQDGLAVDVPSAIPEVTGMGGTTFSENGGSFWNASNSLNNASAVSYIPEQVWNDTIADGIAAASGGGASMYFTRPSWQTGPGLPNDAFRHVPDLAFSASADHDSYYTYSGNRTGYVGGTSAGAPTMAGVVALLNQYLKSNGVGNINPGLYRLAQTAPGVFHDITAGSNNVPCAAGSPDCVNGSFGVGAGPGYDSATGLGSIDVTNFVHAWGIHPATNSAVVVSIDSNPVFQQPVSRGGSAWTFHLTLTEEAGIPTTITDVTIDGVSYTSQILSLFGSSSIEARQSVTARISLSNVAVPKTVGFTFAGVDANGTRWSQQFAVPFQSPQTRLTVSGIANAASGQQVFAPGMLLSVYGTALGNFGQSAATVPLPQYLAGFEASVNGVPAPLYYVSPNQVNIQIPYETRPGNATLTLGNPYENVDYQFRVAAAGPGIFTFADGSVNPSRTGARGQTVTLYVTGEGTVTPSLATGSSPAASTPLARLPQPRQTVSVTVGGVAANTSFAGIPWGLVGVTQINFTIPPDVPAGLQPVVVTVGSAASNPANITVQ